jgi:cobyrinic acid a,c-diamide synthase
MLLIPIDLAKRAKKMPLNRPRIMIAALKGGSGKTILSMGLIAAWREMGRHVAPFKKGPDFIDAGWLAFTAGRSCHNLDPFLMNDEQIRGTFIRNSDQADLALIEGNRGLYDGLDLQGRCSSAELAKLLDTPVIIVVDVSMTTRTVAAIVKGCQVFDKGIHIAGVILNRVGSSRQEALIRNAVWTYCGIQVVGSVPKLAEGIFPERHMGLVPYQERHHAERAISRIKTVVKENLQLSDLWKIAQGAAGLIAAAHVKEYAPPIAVSGVSPRIGFIRDRSFWFYYPENLQQLERMGAILVEINAISHGSLPGLDALYIGGGFPETQAQALADNQPFQRSLHEEIEKGLPVYAECGGLMYLGESLVVDHRTFPMVGALPLKFIIQKRPQWHGYTLLEVSEHNPYYQVGRVLKGHEFHYSQAMLTMDKGVNFAFKVKRGHGLDGLRDGIFRKNVLGTYSHIHAGGDSHWASAIYSAAIDFMTSK